MHTIVQNFASEYVATTYGVQRDSILNTSRFFHVTEGLPMDAMHDLLEGVLQYETKELIKHLISERLISLQDINDAIVSFPYGYADVVNKPLPIADTTLS